MLMSVCLALIIAIPMPRVTIPLDHMDAHVMLDTVEMVSIAQVNWNTKLYSVFLFQKYS